MFQKYKYIIYIFVFSFLVIFFNILKNEYISQGYDKAKQELNNEYTKKLEDNIKKNDELVLNSFKILSENKKLLNTTNMQYKTRLEEANKIIQAENFKCKINKDQVLKLNELTRKPK